MVVLVLILLLLLRSKKPRTLLADGFVFFAITLSKNLLRVTELVEPGEKLFVEKQSTNISSAPNSSAS